MNIDEGEEAGALTVMEHSFTLSAFPNATFLFGVWVQGKGFEPGIYNLYSWPPLPPEII